MGLGLRRGRRRGEIEMLFKGLMVRRGFEDRVKRKEKIGWGNMVRHVDEDKERGKQWK